MSGKDSRYITIMWQAKGRKAIRLAVVVGYIYLAFSVPIRLEVNAADLYKYTTKMHIAPLKIYGLPKHTNKGFSQSDR